MFIPNDNRGYFVRGAYCKKFFGPAQLLIIDPFCKTNNIACGTFAMYRVKQAFDAGYAKLIDEFPSPFSPSYLSRLLPNIRNPPTPNL